MGCGGRQQRRASTGGRGGDRECSRASVGLQAQLRAGGARVQAQAKVSVAEADPPERDGWAPYRRFTHAKHQTCHAHLLKRTGS